MHKTKGAKTKPPQEEARSVTRCRWSEMMTVRQIAEKHLVILGRVGRSRGDRSGCHCCGGWREKLRMLLLMLVRSKRWGWTRRPGHEAQIVALLRCCSTYFLPIQTHFSVMFLKKRLLLQINKVHTSTVKLGNLGNSPRLRRRVDRIRITLQGRK